MSEQTTFDKILSDVRELPKAQRLELVSKILADEMNPEKTLGELLAEAQANASGFDYDEEEIVRITREVRAV